MKLATLFSALLLAFSVPMLTGCDHDDGPAEEIGESLDNAGEDFANAVEDACEDVKDGMNAKDKDC